MHADDLEFPYGDDMRLFFFCLCLILSHPCFSLDYYEHRSCMILQTLISDISDTIQTCRKDIPADEYEKLIFNIEVYFKKY